MEMEEIEPHVVALRPLTVGKGLRPARAPRERDPEGWLTIKQAAARLGVSERTLREHMRSGAVPLRRRGARQGAALAALRAIGSARVPEQTEGAVMAVYKRGETYWYEFNHRGARLRGSTGCTSKREAQEFERAKRQEAAKAHERREALGRGPLTWAVAAARYWEELGQHHRRADGTLWSLEWLTRHLGEAYAA